MVRRKENPFETITSVNNHEYNVSNNCVGALQDINFSIKQDKVLVTVDRKVAGKSRLLKIFSEVTLLINGNIKVKGRIASLLEVETGFHPELIGKETIFVNGSIKGMSKIQCKIDETLDFFRVESYINTSVKRYASGMYVANRVFANFDFIHYIMKNNEH